MRVVGVGRVVDKGEILSGDNADRHAEKVVQRSVPSSIASGQVVVDGDQMRPASLERVEVEGERRDEGLAFAGLHLRDASLVQHDAADQLHIEVAHVEGPFGCLANHRKGLRKEIVEGAGALKVALVLLRPREGLLLALLGQSGGERLPVADVAAGDPEPLPELSRLVLELLIGERGHIGLEVVDERDDAFIALDFTPHRVPEDLIERLLEYGHAPLHSGRGCRSRHHRHDDDVDPGRSCGAQ